MNLPMLLKRIALTQAGIAQQLANTSVVDPSGRQRLAEESARIVADLQAFTDSYIISVVKRK